MNIIQIFETDCLDNLPLAIRRNLFYLHDGTPSYSVILSIMFIKCFWWLMEPTIVLFPDYPALQIECNTHITTTEGSCVRLDGSWKYLNVFLSLEFSNLDIFLCTFALPVPKFLKYFIIWLTTYDDGFCFCGWRKVNVSHVLNITFSY